MFVTFGHTRAGKSTFINKFQSAELAKVGQGQGESTTAEVGIFACKFEPCKLRIFDTPGLNDSRLRFSDKELQEKIKLTLIKHSETGQLDAILLFESCQGESNQLRQTLKKAQELFGDFFNKSAVVILTKYVKGAQIQKIDALRQICSQAQVRHFLWESEDIDDEDMIEQKKSLLYFIHQKIKPFDVTDVQRLQQKIQLRALQLKEQTPKEKHREEFAFELATWQFEDKIECFNYTVSEVEFQDHSRFFYRWCGIQQPVVKLVNKQHLYTVKVPREEMKKHILSIGVKLLALTNTWVYSKFQA